MNVLSKLSIRNLKLNKKRTISTIIGITLSVALICAVSSLGVSFQATLVENAVNETGYYHMQLINVKDEQIKDIESNRDIQEIYPVKKCGYAKLEGSQNKEKPYAKLFSMKKETFEHLKFQLSEGRFPANSKEIVISQAIIRDAKINYKVGDTIDLSMGELDSSNSMINTSNCSFKIVGMIERPHTSFEGYAESWYTIISTGFEQGKNDLYIGLKNPKEYKTSIAELLGINRYDDLDTIKTKGEGKYEDYNINTELLKWEAFAFSNTTVSMLYSVISVVILVILFTSVFCIRNSFAIATTEKIKMYAMLASVGTTKNQIRKNVITEGLLLGVIGIPLGILAGFLAVFVLLEIVNGLLGEYLLSHVDGLVFKISVFPILVSILLGIVTIYLSAKSSAKRASKVSPIEGLRGSDSIKIKKQKLKVPKIISRIFKTGGVLAYKNLKRNKKKYKTTVISIAISIFIFITMNAFIANTFDLTSNYYQDYQYNLLIRGDLTEEEIHKIVSHPTVENYSVLYEAEKIYKIKNLQQINEYETLPLTEEGFYKEEEQFIGNGEKYASLRIVALDDKAFEKYAKEIGVNDSEVKESGILYDYYTIYDKNTSKQKEIRRYKYKKGDIIEGEYDTQKLKIKVGTVAKVKPDGIKKADYEDGYLIIRKEAFKNLQFTLDNITIQSRDASAMQKDSNLTKDGMNVYNIEEAAKEEKAMVLVVKIFLYGFIAVITLIGITNIFNTITSNMELRQKEFAMLKSIGMTKKEFNRMIHLETVFYGMKSWIYGTVMGLLGTFAMYKAFAIKIEQGVYIPIHAIIISAVFVFGFVFMIMRYSMAKINKQNTMETIRKENI